jgi:hypothetical protein
MKDLTIAVYIYRDKLDPPILDITGSLRALVNFGQLETLVIPLQFPTASFKVAAAVQLKDVVPRASGF